MTNGKAARDALIIVAVVILLLVVPEAGLRLLFPGRVARHSPPVWYTPAAEPTDLAYQFNPDYLVSLKSGVEKTFRRSVRDGGDEIRWSTNRFGFRGSEPMEGTLPRIVVYGDSNVQARFSHLENTFPYRLQYHLRAGGLAAAEVLNFGVVGYGPDQSLLRLNSDISQFQPDLVIFHVFASNDYGDLIRNRLYELDESGALVRTSQTATLDQSLLPAERVFDNFASSLLLVRALRKVMDPVIGLLLGREDGPAPVPGELIEGLRQVARREYQVYEHSLPRQFSHFADHYDIDLALDPGSPSARTKVQLMDGILREAYAVATAADVRFLIVIEPPKEDVEGHNIAFTDLQDYPEYRRSGLTDHLERICLENGIDYVNLYRPFSENTGGPLYFAEDGHWNDHGQEVAAIETAGHILNASGY